jgi:hypothetical protein
MKKNGEPLPVTEVAKAAIGNTGAYALDAIQTLFKLGRNLPITEDINKTAKIKKFPYEKMGKPLPFPSHEIPSDR